MRHLKLNSHSDSAVANDQLNVNMKVALQRVRIYPLVRNMETFCLWRAESVQDDESLPVSLVETGKGIDKFAIHSEGGWRRGLSA